MRSQPQYQPGDLISDKYQVGPMPARMGGMGEVYLCLKVDEGIPVALKTFQQKYVTATGLRQAFEEEVAHWVALEKHPNIVRCRQMEILDNQPFMVLEWINGEPEKGSELRGWLRDGALDLETALNFAIDIVRGLVWAQQKSPGITHRDLKPGNILIEQGGRAKITDFALAAISSRTCLEIEPVEGDSRHSMQAKGGIAGTPPYMAPEQLEGLIPDPRDDIYSLGCILYEMLTGEMAFQLKKQPRSHTKAIQAYCRLHQAGGIPALPTIIPGPVRELIRHCLAKTRDERFTSAGALLETLAQVYTETLGKAPCDMPEPGVFTAVDFNNRGVTYSNLKRHEQAIADYDQAIALNPEYAAAYANRGGSYNALGQHQRAIADCDQAIALDSQGAVAYYNRGNSYRNLGQHQRAIADYDQAIALDPQYAKAYYNRGASYAALGQHQRAIADYDQAIALDPSLVQAYYNRGGSYADLGQPQRAITDYDQAIALNPSLALAYANRGLSYADLGQHQRAIADYDQAIALDPNFALAYANRGASYHNLGQHQRAIADCDQAIALDPNFALAYVNRGISYAALSKPQRAIADYDQAIAFDPSLAQAYLNKAVVLAQIGQFDAAIKVAQKAHQMGHPKAMRLIGLVQQNMSGSSSPTIPFQAAFKAFHRAGSPDDMRQAVQQYPLLLDPDLIKQIEQVHVPIFQRTMFKQRLAWLKQIAKGS